MARRRADSPEAAAVILPQRLQATTKPDASSRQTRTSPRKRASVANYASESETENTPPSHLVLKPKGPAPRSNDTRRIRLAPLSSFNELPPLSASDLPQDPRPKRASPKKRLASSKPAFKLSQDLSDDVPSTSDANEAVSLHDSVSVGGVEDDAFECPVELPFDENHDEESIWCGSGDDSGESEDELPSPWKLLDLPPPKPTSRPKIARRHGGTLCDANSGLDVFSSVSEVTQLPSKGKAGHPSEIPASRPTSSSDRELGNQAVLRFSPPRLYSPRKTQSPARGSTPPPTSPSKSRLLSPSKKKSRIPTPPMRPSLDTFWNPTAVNEWNDQYSPEKLTKSPKKSRFQIKEGPASPAGSPRKPPDSPAKRTKAELTSRRTFEERKHRVAELFLEELDRTITSGQIASLAASTGGVRFVWSKTLNSTAGRANWRRDTTKTRKLDGTVEVTYKHHASIELAGKVIDDEHRLLNVIAHEFCHLANFMVSGIKDQPHGRQFKVWGEKCSKAFADRGVEVTTKHSYQIEYKYIWQCENEECSAEFKRHSKSINPVKQRCGQCKGALLQVKPAPRGGKAKGEATGYAAYVKRYYKEVKAGLPAGATQKQVMEALGRRYRAGKELGVAIGQPIVAVPSSGEPRCQSSDEVDAVARKLEFVVLDDD